MPLFTTKRILTSIGLVVAVLFLLVLIFIPYIFKSDLDPYQSQQTEMARVFLAEQLGVKAEEVITAGGCSVSPFLHGYFSLDFVVGEKRYTVENRNTWLRARLGLRGQMRVLRFKE